MKKLETREVQRWSARWFSENRKQEVKPFYLTPLLEDFQRTLEELNATEQRHEPEDDQQQHQGTAHGKDLRQNRGE